MQGILHSHYKLVENYLAKLHEENLVNSYCPYYETILQHKEKLNLIYENYKVAFEQITFITKQFEEHKQSVRRLIIMQKKKKKELNKAKQNLPKNNLFEKRKRKVVDLV
jgi:hypothetical protein